MLNNVFTKQKSILLLFLTLSILFILSCSSCNTSKTQQPSEDTVKHFPKKHFEPLAPGTVKIKGTLTSYQNKNGETLCKIFVTKVLGYGPTTSPIAVNSNLLVSLTNEKVNGLGTPLHELQKSGKLIELKIISRKLPVNSNKSIEIWKVIKFNFDSSN